MTPAGSSLPGDGIESLHPLLLGTRHMAVPGHYGAAHAAFTVLEAGGNAVDAGVAAGTWPRAATADFFRTRHGGRIPQGILRTVVPAAPDAWLTALAKFGTMSFGDCGRRRSAPPLLRRWLVAGPVSSRSRPTP